MRSRSEHTAVVTLQTFSDGLAITEVREIVFTVAELLEDLLRVFAQCWWRSAGVSLEIREVDGIVDKRKLVVLSFDGLEHVSGVDMGIVYDVFDRVD